MFAAIAALLGAIIGGASTFLGTWYAQRQAWKARVAESKTEVYLDLLKHLDELETTAFGSSVAALAYIEDPRDLPQARYATWYLRMQMLIPDHIHKKADVVIDYLIELAEARYDHHSINGTEMKVDESHPDVLAANARVKAARENLIKAIKKDINLAE